MKGIDDLRFMEIGELEVLNGNAQVIASLGGRPLLVAGTYGEGRFVVVGDVHLLDNRWYQDPMNQVFAMKLFRWVTHMEE